MPTWTNPVIHATADDLPVTDYNNIANNTTFLYQRPYAIAFATATTSIATGGNVLVNLQGLTSGYGFTLVGSALVLPLTGVYSVSFSCYLFNPTTGFMQSNLNYNGTTIIGGSTIPANSTGESVSNGSGIFLGTAGSGLSLVVNQNSGSTQTAQASALLTFIAASYVGSQ